MKLVIGNKNYSSWSLRPWLLLSHFGIAFEEERINLGDPDKSTAIGRYSPTAKVPVLLDGTLKVWDSLAICEYVSEHYLEGRGWPEKTVKRAEARSLCAEMHTGFGALRTEMPMNCRARRSLDLSEVAIRDVQRVDDIWSQLSARNAFRGPWLFGEFSIVDCFFAPVALRFNTYGIHLTDGAGAYQKHLLTEASLQKWIAAAGFESAVIPAFECGELRE